MLNAKDIQSRSSLALAIGFGTLVVLIAVLGIGAMRRAKKINAELENAQDSYLQAESFRAGIASDMYLADILVRDYLLDPSPQNTAKHREQLLALRSSLQDRLDELAKTIPDAKTTSLPRLREEVQEYWDSLNPMFEWTPQEKAERSWSVLRHNVLPHRQAVEALAGEMAKINKDNLDRERENVRASEAAFHTFLMRMMIFSLLFGTVVALLTTYQVANLERRDDERRKQIEEAEDSLRRLSRRLVQAQEGERKALSRELHDEVGQTLTALGIEIANLEKLRAADGAAFRERMEEAKRLNADAMRAIRDLAMGLRPSMLDDLGLEPALQWQGREFSRHTGVPATVQVEGVLDDLNDAQRTCIYRVVQEALTNCARHAKAKNVLVAVRADGDRVILVVQDDGVGFDGIGRRQGGLGLVGIKERVEAIDGHVVISSKPNKGTSVRAEIPAGVAV